MHMFLYVATEKKRESGRDRLFFFVENISLIASTPLMDSNRSKREVGGWGRDPKKCTGRDWGMESYPLMSPTPRR